VTSSVGNSDGAGIVHPRMNELQKSAESCPRLLDWLANDFAAHGYDCGGWCVRCAEPRVSAREWTGATRPRRRRSWRREHPIPAKTLARSAASRVVRRAEDAALRPGFCRGIPDLLPRVRARRFSSDCCSRKRAARGCQGRSRQPAVRLGEIRHRGDRLREDFRVTLDHDHPTIDELTQGMNISTRTRPARRGRGQLIWSLVTGRISDNH